MSKNLELEGYKQIEIPSSPPEMEDGYEVVEVDLDDLTDFNPEEIEALKKGDDSFVKVPVKQGAPEDDVEDGVEQEEEEPEVKQTSQPKKYKSRAKERIRELVRSNKELERELEAERARGRQLARKFLDGEHQSRETLISNMKAQVSILNKQVAEALQNGDSESVVNLNNDIVDLKVQIATLDQNKPKTSKEMDEEDQDDVKPTRPQPRTSQKALDWVADYPEFKTDPVFNAAALAVNNVLIREGYDPDTDDFYEELNERLSKKFPEVFGTDEENDVEYNEMTESASPQKSKSFGRKTKEAPKQIVSGASRGTRNVNTGGSTKTNKDAVKLSPQDIRTAEEWGWSLVKMAKYKQHIEKAKRSDGYASIIIGDIN